MRVGVWICALVYAHTYAYVCVFTEAPAMVYLWGSWNYLCECFFLSVIWISVNEFSSSGLVADIFIHWPITLSLLFVVRKYLSCKFFFRSSAIVTILSTFFCTYVCITTTDNCSYHVLFFSWPLDEYLLWLIHSVFTTAFPVVIFTLTKRWKQYLGA